MSNHVITIRQSAYEDLEAIWEYTRKTWSIEQADKYYTEITDAFESLRNNPKIGKSANHIRKGYNSLKINKHLIFYKVCETEIDIIRILHAQMDIPNQLRK